MYDCLLRRAVVQLVQAGPRPPGDSACRHSLVSPHLADHVPLRAGRAGVTDKGREQLVLCGAEVGFLASDQHKPFYEIHRQIPDRKTA